MVGPRANYRVARYKMPQVSGPRQGHSEAVAMVTAACKALHLTQTALAGRAQISAASLSSWLSGKRGLGARYAEKLARTLWPSDSVAEARFLNLVLQDGQAEPVPPRARAAVTAVRADEAFHRQEWDAAAKLYLDAHRQSGRASLDAAKHLLRAARCYTVVGSWELAADRIMEAFALGHHYDVETAVEHARLSADLLRWDSDPEPAIHLLEQALSVSTDSSGEPLEELLTAAVLMDLAVTFLDAGRRCARESPDRAQYFTMAEARLKEAQAFNARTGTFVPLALTNVRLSHVYQELTRPSAARTALAKAATLVGTYWAPHYHLAVADLALSARHEPDGGADRYISANVIAPWAKLGYGRGLARAYALRASASGRLKRGSVRQDVIDALVADGLAYRFLSRDTPQVLPTVMERHSSDELQEVGKTMVGSLDAGGPGELAHVDRKNLNGLMLLSRRLAAGDFRGYVGVRRPSQNLAQQLSLAK